MRWTAAMCLSSLALALLGATCDPQVPPTDPNPPPEEPTRLELCTQVCERYDIWGCAKADVCEEFSDAIGEDGSLICLTKRPCPEDCVENPRAWPASLECALELVGGPMTCGEIEAACPLPGAP